MDTVIKYAKLAHIQRIRYTEQSVGDKNIQSYKCQYDYMGSSQFEGGIVGESNQILTETGMLHKALITLHEVSGLAIEFYVIANSDGLARFSAHIEDHLSFVLSQKTYVLEPTYIYENLVSRYTNKQPAFPGSDHAEVNAWLVLGGRHGLGKTTNSPIFFTTNFDHAVYHYMRLVSKRIRTTLPEYRMFAHVFSPIVPQRFGKIAAIGTDEKSGTDYIGIRYKYKSGLVYVRPEDVYLMDELKDVGDPSYFDLIGFGNHIPDTV